MAVILKGKSYILVDHEAFVNKIYKEVAVDNSIKLSFRINFKLFCIKPKLIKDGIRKRKHTDEYPTEVIAVQMAYDDFLKEIPNDWKDSKLNLTDIKMVRELSQSYFESTLFDHNGLNGGNNSEIPLQCKVKDETFLLPPNSRFFCGCVKEQCQKIICKKYDILIADPPWWNKYIRRLKSANDKLSYSMMYNVDIAAIPVSSLLATNCLVAVWCTNAPSNIDAVKNQIFPKWGVEYVTTWYWLKVTIDLQPMCPFSAGCKKQPYERIIIGKVGQVKEIPNEKLVISVPSALHSHKPPLIEILKPYLKEENPATLELFARYLLPNTTSIGFEPLKWQHLSLYESTNKDDDT